VPQQRIGDLTGWAGGVNVNTVRAWAVTVFDRASAAVAYAHLATRKPVSPQYVVLRANNVVYVGTPFPAASRAMAQLSHQ
jgi:hypothetical protein